MKLLIATFLTVLTQVGGCLLFYWSLSGYFTPAVLFDLIGRDLYYTALPTIFLTLLVQYFCVLFGAHLLNRAKRAEQKVVEAAAIVGQLEDALRSIRADEARRTATIIPIRK